MFSALVSSSWPRLRRVAWLSSAAVLAVLAVRFGSQMTADRLGKVIAQQLAAVLLPIVPAAPAVASESTAKVELVLSETPEAARPATAKRPLGAARRKPSPAAHAGVRISSAQVLALAARRVMPQAVPVPATALHPKGLQLSGVSALGVGLKDGDVLTEAAGQSVSSVAVVVGIVLSARGRLVPEISGRFFRGGVPYGLTVEQPYPKSTVPG